MWRFPCDIGSNVAKSCMPCLISLYLLAGVSVFGAFLRSEFSEENLQFYLACEQYRHSSNNFSLQKRAKDICSTYIQPGSPREVHTSFYICLSECIFLKLIYATLFQEQALEFKSCHTFLFFSIFI